jgi:hypothetical protein
MAERDMNNISALNKQFADSSEARFLRERAERVLRRALLVDYSSKNQQTEGCGLD